MWWRGREGVAKLDDICWLLLALITGGIELLPTLELVMDTCSSAPLSLVVSAIG
jgi:hypothetical protein